MRRDVWTLIKGAFPAVAMATLIPLGVFYVALLTAGLVWAIGASVVYAYAVAGFQIRRKGQISGMLIMTVFMATTKVAAAVLSGHLVMFFVVPVVETAGFGMMFVITLLAREPLLVRLGRDLAPHAAAGLAANSRLTRNLSVMWAFTYLGSALTTLALLLWTPLSVYAGAHTLTGWIWSGSAGLASVVLCRREGITLLGRPVLAPVEPVFGVLTPALAVA